MKLVTGLTLTALAGIVYGHTILKRSYPTPKGFTHGKSKEYYKNITASVTMKQVFQEMYQKMITNGQSNGYFSENAVPYHSVEELMVEAPDYGHETTSEAYSYYIWITAWNIWATGDTSDFEAAWENLIEYIIPGDSDQVKEANAAYNPEYPAEYAPEYPSPDQYPAQMYENKDTATGQIVKVGVDPLNDDIGKAYGIPNANGGYTITPWMTHWLLDVDNIYGFGKHESGSSSDRNVYINTYQRGSNESVWRTIPQPDWESFKYGQQNSWHNGPSGFTTLFSIPAPYDEGSPTPKQWKYTGAPDADARTIQATWWANYFSKQKNKIELTTQIGYALKLGDFIRYSMFDKYFKPIPCWDYNCEPTTWDNSYNSTTYLLNWYASWGGSQEGAMYPFAFRIGSSAAHQGYQNSFTAWILSGLSGDSMWTLKSEGGQGHWRGSYYRTLEFWTWLQTNKGPIGGGATNSWLGSYQNPNEYGITGFFYKLAYTWEPVYHDPPSNNWFGMNVWSQGRNAETYWATQSSESGAILDRWVTWILSIQDQIIIDNGNDFQVPSNFNWTGQPLTWDPNVGWTGNKNPSYTASITSFSKDIGTASALAHVLTFYAAASTNSNLASGAKSMAKNLLYILYMYMGDIGIDIDEERQDYIGNEYGQGFNEPVYVPKEWGTGYYPNKIPIQNGATFISLRPWYENVKGYSYVQQCEKTNTAPKFKYHRFWAQAEYAIACAAYSWLFEGSQVPKYELS